MLRSFLIYGVLLAAVIRLGSTAEAQSASRVPDPGQSYRLRLAVDEVVVTFNAEDANGSPVNDLKAEEIRLWDNGVAPRKVVAFDELVNRPIRAGILIDTSESMRDELAANKSIATKFAQRIFRQHSDEATVSEFGEGSNLIQSWTKDLSLLLQAVSGARNKGNLSHGTALFNAVFQACSSSFANLDPTATGNFILLFSDGEDNAGLTTADDATRACQRSNTQIFAFVPALTERQVSTGPRVLRELAAKTGGKVFVADDSDDAIWKALKAIESEMRNQYRLVYNPVNFKHDGALHEIMLEVPERVKRIEVRTGYFAPRQ